MKQRIEKQLMNKNTGIVYSIEQLNEDLKEFSMGLASNEPISIGKKLANYLETKHRTSIPTGADTCNVVSKLIGVELDEVKSELGWESVDGRKTTLSVICPADGDEYIIRARREARDIIPESERKIQRKSKTLTKEGLKALQKSIIEYLDDPEFEVKRADIRLTDVDLIAKNEKTKQTVGFIIAMPGRGKTNEKAVGSTSSGCATVKHARESGLDKVAIISLTKRNYVPVTGTLKMLMKNGADTLLWDGTTIRKCIIDNPDITGGLKPYKPVKSVELGDIISGRTSPMVTVKGEASRNIISSV